MSPAHIAHSNSRGKWRQRTLRYTVALAATGVALGISFLWPVMRQDPFAIFIAAVIVSARFAGFGPALLCTAASSLAIDYFIFEPRFSFALSANDYGRLVVFIAVSILTASLARQRSRAQTRAEQTQRQMAAMVESSDDAILTGDVNGIITSWNPGAERLYGYSAAEAIGMPVEALGPPERPDEVPGITRKVMRGSPSSITPRNGFAKTARGSRSTLAFADSQRAWRGNRRVQHRPRYQCAAAFGRSAAPQRKASHCGTSRRRRRPRNQQPSRSRH